jgi:hypothetical protein
MVNPRVLLGLTLLCAASACVPGEPEPDPSDDPLPDETRWYIGVSETSFPGVPGGLEEEVLIRRTVSPEHGTLVESVISEGGTSTPARFEIEGTVTVGESESSWTFGFSDASGDFEGEGTLHGEAWAWDSWESTTTYVTGPYVGSYVESEDERTDDGIVASKRVYSPEDHFEASIDEVLERVDEAAWDARAEELGL